MIRKFHISEEFLEKRTKDATPDSYPRSRQGRTSELQSILINGGFGIICFDLKSKYSFTKIIWHIMGKVQLHPTSPGPSPRFSDVSFLCVSGNIDLLCDQL